jgi:hypothetical protein
MPHPHSANRWASTGEPDPAVPRRERTPRLRVQGTGKFMRHVKLKPGTPTNAAALSSLIDAAYSDIKARVEND